MASEQTIRCARRGIECTLELNDRGEVIALHITYHQPRPYWDLINWHLLLNPPPAVQGPVHTGGPPPRPCGGR